MYIAQPQDVLQTKFNTAQLFIANTRQHNYDSRCYPHQVPLQSNASVLTDNDFLHQAAHCAKALVAEFYDTCDSVAHSVCFTHCIISTFSISIATFCNGFTFQNSSQSKLILIPFHCIEYCVYFSNRCSSDRQSCYILMSFLPER